jgi:hypothetical protein
MKLAAVYSVFDGEELLPGSINQIRPHVDLVILVSSTRSHDGLTSYEGGAEMAQKLRAAGVVEMAISFKPDTRFGANYNTRLENERAKRMKGLRAAALAGASHVILMDCDEYYHTGAFGRARAYMAANNRHGSVVRLRTYFRQPTWQVHPPEEYFVPFIHRIDHRAGKPVIMNWRKYPYYVDPSRALWYGRKIGLGDVPDLTTMIGCEMHHYSYVRRDMVLKLKASTATTNIMKPGTFSDLKAARPGYKFQHLFTGREIREVPNFFNIPTWEISD